MGVFRVGVFVARKDVKVALAILAVVGVAKLGAGSACDAWSDSQPDPSTWNEDLPPCPNTYRQAQVARADYIPDGACRVGGSVPILGNCWFHQGRPEFNEDNAAACFRSIKFNIHGAGGQCCYNDAGQIITRGTGAGSDDRYHSDKTFWKHQLHDVLPFIACCKLQSDPETCNKYLRNRPSRPGSDTRGQFGGAWGDPHFFTFDGTSYTFNGYGEYTYLVVPSQPSVAFDTSIPLRFESQIRTTPLTTDRNDVTVIKAFAARVGLLKISITVSRRNQLLVHLNDEELQFESNADAITALNTITLRFDDFSIAKNLADNQLTLSWAIGINVQITPVSVDTISTLVLNVAAAISGELEGNWTLGLIGSYDRNPSNDLRDSFGTVIGTVDTLSSEQIHEHFGMTWAIDPTRSLFYYESNDNAYFYWSQNVNYRPSFQEPSAGSLESTVRETCGIPINSNNQSQWSPVQRTCYYDISVTRDVAFGRISRQTAEDQIEQREAIRNPPRFNSALSLTQSVRIGEQVTLSFEATSEFTSNITYSLLHGPSGASFNEATGQFQWIVPDSASSNSRIPVQVSAQDAVYNLTSTYEVVLEIQQETTTSAITTSTISLPGGD